MEWNLEQDFVLRIGEIGRNETRSREPGALIAPCQVVAKFFTSKRFVVRLSFPSLRGRNYESAQTLAKKKLFEKFQRAETKGESRRNREGGSSRGRAGSVVEIEKNGGETVRNAIQTMGGGEAESERKKFKKEERFEDHGAINRERKRE